MADQSDSGWSNEDLDPELQRQLAEQQQREDERLQELDRTCQREIENRMESINSQVTHSFESRMAEFETRYQSHAHDSITGRQTDVLRVNKIIREVSRGLGTEWKPVYLILMKDFPQSDVALEVEKIDKQKPYMQGYKALQTWRDAMGDEFHVHHLVSALKECGKSDLVNVVMDITECNETGSLMTIRGFGKDSAGGDTGEGAVRGESVVQRKASMNNRKSVFLEDMEAPLGDRKFLQLSRKLGTAWLALGKALEVPEEEIQEIRASEDGYQAAFKLLWTWRDAVGDTNGQAVSTLAQALRNIGKPELAAIVAPQQFSHTQL